VGEFKVRCAEMCGTGHAYMQAPLKVVEESAFQEWVKAQTSGAQAGVQTPPAGAEVPAPAPAEAGKQHAQQLGCTACHSADGSTLVGPTWKGLFGSEVPLQDGSTVVADEDYLRSSIVDPGVQIVQGFPDVMPKNYQEQLSPEQIQAIVEYIKSLR
jgi:cytochrome c oxidase subunit 2